MIKIGYFFSLLLILSFTNCKKVKVNKENVPLEKGISYFPENFFSKIDAKMEIIDKPYPHPKIEYFINEKERDTVVDHFSSESLFLFNEPIIYNIDSDKEIYRFTKINSFESDFVVRIESSKNEKKIFWKVLSKNKDLSSDKIVIDKENKLSNVEWNNFINKLDDINFWKIYPNNNHSGFDGSSWLLEGFKNNKYYAVQFWSPKDEKFKETCNYLFNLTDIK